MTVQPGKKEGQCKYHKGAVQLPQPVDGWSKGDWLAGRTRGWNPDI